ncbi:hypothetical protein EJ08DRAFT_647779 [Tothia fuscella]|uniref:Uncharacterized protein n=1 Tax=Tothia fuscella TaxID=1048955 RepID=A0A9P4NXK8_9PEZI|nr:hypothetical protein EJ08DRAFT_647779 [Tothia fuscella]
MMLLQPSRATLATFFGFLISSSPAIAAPTLIDSLIHPRQGVTHTFSVILCVDANFKSCDTFAVLFGTCYNFPEVFNSEVSSYKMPPYVGCTLYNDGGCSSKGYMEWHSDWDKDLRNILNQKGLNDLWSSMVCYTVRE